MHGARVRMGERLAEEAPVEADLVLPIPDSGTPAAIGFARASGIPFSEGLIKNRYVGRTFIQPDQGLRQQGIRLKFNPLAEVAGKRVVVVDDSIVRGNTTRQIVAMLFDAGAAEVHMRISSPPVDRAVLLRDRLRRRRRADRGHALASRRSASTSARRRSPTSRSRASRRRRAGPATELCRACLTGEYPTQVPLVHDEAPVRGGSARLRAAVGSPTLRRCAQPYCSSTRLALAIPRLRM